jgi:hypothetical protein
VMEVHALLLERAHERRSVNTASFAVVTGKDAPFEETASATAWPSASTRC